MTPVIPERRKPLTRKQRVEQHDREGGICCVCGLPIAPGERFIDEHLVPLALGGSNHASNRGVAHIGCAKIKTRDDQGRIAKAIRQRANHLGVKRKPKGRPMPGSRASGVKRKFSGEVVRR